MFRLPFPLRLALYLACFGMIFALGLSSMRAANAGPRALLAAQPLTPYSIDAGALNQSFKVNPNGATLPGADSTFSGITDALGNIQSQMVTYAERLFLLLVGLDVFWMTAQFLLQKDNLGEFLSQLAVKIITVIFLFYVVVEHGTDLATVIIGSFSKAANNVNVANFQTGLSPTAILLEGAGFAAIPVTEAGILDALPDEVLGNGSTNDIKAESEMLTGAAFAIFAVFAGIAAELAVATIEIYVVLNLGIIVTGFLGSRWSERYGQGFVSFAINAGVKYMFVIIMLGLIYPVLLELASFEAIPIVGPAMFAASALVCAAILHAVPGFAASAMSGTSNSSGAQLAGAFSQAFGSAGALAKMGSAAVKGGATDRINAKVDQQREAQEERTATARIANSAMMREEGSDQRRARSFADLATGGGGANGSNASAGNAVPVTGNGAASAATRPAFGSAAAAAARSTNGAASAGQSANAASAGNGPARGALPPNGSGGSARPPVLGTGPSPTGPGTPQLGASPAASPAVAGPGGMDVSAPPATAFSPAGAGSKAGGSDASPAAADTLASAAATGAFADPFVAATPKTLGGFVQPQLSDALAPADGVGVGIAPLPFGVSDPPITPLGAASGGGTNASDSSNASASTSAFAAPPPNVAAPVTAPATVPSAPKPPSSKPAAAPSAIGLGAPGSGASAPATSANAPAAAVMNASVMTPAKAAPTTLGSSSPPTAATSPAGSARATSPLPATAMPAGPPPSPAASGGAPPAPAQGDWKRTQPSASQPAHAQPPSAAPPLAPPPSAARDVQSLQAAPAKPPSAVTIKKPSQ